MRPEDMLVTVLLTEALVFVVEAVCIVAGALFSIFALHACCGRRTNIGVLHR